MPINGLVRYTATAIAVVVVAGPAATTPLPEAFPLGDTAGEMLRNLAESARMANTPPAQGTIKISVEAWSLSTGDGGAARTSTITPPRSAITCTTDDTLTNVVTAGTPLGTSDADTPREGELLWQEAWAADQDPYRFGTQAPINPEVIAQLLAEPTGEDPPVSASTSIDEIAGLLLEQKLSSAQTAAVLEYLARLPDLRVDGITTDRLGSDGILFSATNPDDPAYAEHIVIAPGNCRILAVERTYEAIAALTPLPPQLSTTPHGAENTQEDDRPIAGRLPQS